MRPGIQAGYVRLLGAVIIGDICFPEFWRRFVTML